MTGLPYALASLPVGPVPAFSAAYGPYLDANFTYAANGNAAISVRNFGAKGDGTTDDTAAFVAALATGSDVFVPDGVYKITSQVTINGQGLIGAGPHAIIRAGLANFHMFKLSGDGCCVRNLVFQGAAVDDTTTQSALLTDSVSVPTNIEISGCIFGGPSSGHSLNIGLFFQGYGESNFRIFGNHFKFLVGTISGTGYAILCGAVVDGAIFGNTFQGIRGTHGRHAVYLSAGATRVVVYGNTCDSFNYEAYTLNQYAPQPPNDTISFVANICENCGGDGVDQSSMSVFGACKNITLADNQIILSVGSGITINADGRASNDIAARNNRITDPNYFGIVMRGTKYFVVDANLISGASRKTAQTYSDIDVGTDGTTAPTILVTSNKGVAVAGRSRSPFNINTTTPAPLIVKVDGNDFPSTDYFTGPTYNTTSVLVWLDGRLQYVTTYDPPNIANGASDSQNYSIAGADQGDIVTVGFTTPAAGFVITGQAYTTNGVKVVFGNLSGGAVDLVSGTLRIDVWKRDGYNL